MALKNQLTTSDHLPYNEFVRLLNCLRADKDYYWEIYARLSFYTGCRASDVLNLKWKDFLGKPSTIVLEKKTKKPRVVSFFPKAQSSLREMWDLMGRPDVEDYVMASSHGGKPITIQRVNQKLKEFKHKYKLNIGNFSTHTFRKTFGRYVYDTNHHSAESLLLLNRILNHTSIEATKAYIGITKDEIASVYASIRI